MSLELKSNPTLKDFQDYVLKMKQERGFNTTDKFYECCLLADMHDIDLEQSFREKEEKNKQRSWKRL